MIQLSEVLGAIVGGDVDGLHRGESRFHQQLQFALIAEAGDTATMTIQTHFTNRASMEQTIEMGFEQGMIETVNQIDPLLDAARA